MYYLEIVMLVTNEYMCLCICVCSPMNVNAKYMCVKENEEKIHIP